MPHLHQHVVRDVDAGTDWPDARGLQPSSHPVRGHRVSQLGDCRRIARAELIVVDRHRDMFGLSCGDGCQLDSSIRAIRRLTHRQVVRGGDLSGQSENRETVGPVRCHLEVDDRVADAHRFDGRDLEPSERKRGCELVGGGADVDEVTDPGNEELHDRSDTQCGNCSRKRRSFSKNSRMSWTWCRRIATRSIPMPNAKPV